MLSMETPIFPTGFLHGMGRIGKQIDYNLMNLSRVRLNRYTFGGDFRLESDLRGDVKTSGA